MTCENNKKGCNNKILIRTLMLVSMVCMLSVSDMLGMESSPQRIDPDEAMKKINKNDETSKKFYEIFKGHEDLIKKNCCCCCGIDIKRTKLPKDLDNDSNAPQLTVYEYIHDRFAIQHDNAGIADDWDPYNATCKALDTIIEKIYEAQPAS